jgi:hypothetical protein
LNTLENLLVAVSGLAIPNIAKYSAIGHFSALSDQSAGPLQMRLAKTVSVDHPPKASTRQAPLPGKMGALARKYSSQRQHRPENESWLRNLGLLGALGSFGGLSRHEVNVNNQQNDRIDFTSYAANTMQDTANSA